MVATAPPASSSMLPPHRPLLRRLPVFRSAAVLPRCPSDTSSTAASHLRPRIRRFLTFRSTARMMSPPYLPLRLGCRHATAALPAPPRPTSPFSQILAPPPFSSSPTHPVSSSAAAPLSSAVEPLCTGAFAKVYKASVDGSTEDLVALKIQKPAFPWEFYMYRQLDVLISDIERPGFGYAHEVHVFADVSVLVCDYLPYGTLLPRYIRKQEDKHFRVTGFLRIEAWLQWLRIFKDLLGSLVVHLLAHEQFIERR